MIACPPRETGLAKNVNDQPSDREVVGSLAPPGSETRNGAEMRPVVDVGTLREAAWWPAWANLPHVWIEPPLPISVSVSLPCHRRICLSRLESAVTICSNSRTTSIDAKEDSQVDE